MEKDLFELAKAAMANAYAPYSNFNVGAAIRTETGKLYHGANVENAAYPEGACAEASAISAMVCDGERRIKEIAIIGHGDKLVTPCGGCRQKIREFSTPGTLIHVCGPEGLKKTFKLSELLPEAFGPENINDNSS